MRKINKIPSEMAYIKKAGSVDTGKAWMKVYQRLNDEGLLPEPARQARVYPNAFKRLAYAATILLLIAVGGLAYLFLYDSSAPHHITLSTGSEMSTFVQTLDDGSVIYIGDNSELNYPETFGKEQREVFFSGEAFFDVKNNTGHPFVIETSQARIEVLGTAFNVKSFDEEFELIVEEGQVLVTSKLDSDYSEVIGEWEMLSFAGGDIMKSGVIDRTYLSWRINRMQFRDEKISNIASVIKKNFNVSFLFEDESINDRRLTVTFHNNAITTIAEVIAAAYGLEYEISSDSEILFVSKN